MPFSDPFLLIYSASESRPEEMTPTSTLLLHDGYRRSGRQALVALLLLLMSRQIGLRNAGVPWRLLG